MKMRHCILAALLLMAAAQPDAYAQTQDRGAAPVKKQLTLWKGKQAYTADFDIDIDRGCPALEQYVAKYLLADSTSPSLTDAIDKFVGTFDQGKRSPKEKDIVGTYVYKVTKETGHAGKYQTYHLLWRATQDEGKTEKVRKKERHIVFDLQGKKVLTPEDVFSPYKAYDVKEASKGSFVNMQMNDSGVTWSSKKTPSPEVVDFSSEPQSFNDRFAKLVDWNPLPTAFNAVFNASFTFVKSLLNKPLDETVTPPDSTRHSPFELVGRDNGKTWAIVDKSGKNERLPSFDLKFDESGIIPQDFILKVVKKVVEKVSTKVDFSAPKLTKISEKATKSASAATAPYEDGTKVFENPEEMPSFPGGRVALMKWLAKRMKYPKEAEEKGIKGRVICTFVVEKNGKITDVKVMRSVHPLLDAEALRVVRSMPKWQPGKLNGKPVRVKFTIPLTFNLQ